jgi:DnaJ-class molecular chaperone
LIHKIDTSTKQPFGFSVKDNSHTCDCEREKSKMASEKPKRCHYEVLGLSRDCSADEIRSAYKKMALQRHPDKLVQSGLSQAEATA